MDKKREILKEIHLYPDKNELLIKDIIWAISWIGGIYTINNTGDKRALASAYLIFSLSLLMEFGSRIKRKKEYISRIVDGIFCCAIISILLMAIIALVGAPLLPNHYKVMYIISIGVMLFILMDFVVTWIEPEYIIPKNVSGNVEENNPDYEEISNIFQEKLAGGNLGDIPEGKEKNE